VTSISVDLHKYGYAAKGASVILYRDPELRRHQFFACTDWPGGIYVSPTMTGTRAGGAIAAAWAIMHRLGHDGYLAIAREVMQTTRELQAGVEQIEGIEVLGRPAMSVMALGSRSHDIYRVGDQLTARGWHLDRQQHPPSLHLTVNRAHCASAHAFLADLREAVARCPEQRVRRLLGQSAMAAAGAAARLLPSSLLRRLSRSVTRGEPGGAGVPRRSAAMYGLMAALPEGDLHQVVVDVLDRLTRPDPPPPASGPGQP
jgi:glutamate/tyrosine decarboxylase-like PLP-dependent enzyme